MRPSGFKPAPTLGRFATHARRAAVPTRSVPAHLFSGQGLPPGRFALYRKISSSNLPLRLYDRIHVRKACRTRNPGLRGMLSAIHHYLASTPVQSLQVRARVKRYLCRVRGEDGSVRPHIVRFLPVRHSAPAAHNDPDRTCVAYCDHRRRGHVQPPDTPLWPDTSSHDRLRCGAAPEEHHRAGPCS